MSMYSAFAREYEQIFPFRDEVYRFLRFHAGAAGGKVLDVGCGPGHYCGRFAGDGYRAAGIDLDPQMIAVARERYPSADFHCLDMRDIASAGVGYGCIYSIGNVVSHLQPERRALFVQNVQAMLAPGGRWAMQIMNWDALAGVDRYDFPVRTIGAGADVLSFHRRYDRLAPESFRFSVSLRLGGREVFGEHAALYPVAAATLRLLHQDAGLTCLGTWADFKGSPPVTEPGTGLVMVFEKPSAQL